MSYFFSRSLRSFNNPDKTIQCFIFSEHIELVENYENQTKAIIMPLKYGQQRANGTTPEKWSHEGIRNPEDYTIVIKSNDELTTVITLSNKGAGVKWFSQGKTIMFTHVLGTKFNTKTEIQNI